MSYTRIVPLGGLGEVGMNCLAIETPDGILVVDCGVTFPHEEPGVDVIHPDFSYLWQRRDDVHGVVITHGHEDHIGALPYLLRRIPVPVWAPPYAEMLVRARLAEHTDIPAVDLRTTTPREVFRVGPFSVEPLRVTHSIPDATALCIDTPAGRVFHTGDFKFEERPLDDQPSDESRFRELGDEGVAVLLSDSTNVDVPGSAGNERAVAKALETMVARENGRVVVAMFASNVFRMQSLCALARRCDRKVVLLGRGVQTHARAAMDIGRLKIPSDLMVPPDMAMALPARQVLAIAGGTQAEPGSALSRLADGEHPKMRLEGGDAVVFSSRAIPGNERGVFDMVCKLERRGVRVHFRERDNEMHASGHAARDEQTRMIQLVRPRSFVPVHGTFHHLKRHAELARELGVERAVVIENGSTVQWRDGDLTRSEPVQHGRVHIDEGVAVSDEVLRERVVMAEQGVVVATVEVDKRGMLVGDAVITTRGVAASAAGDPGAEIRAALVHGKGALDALSVEGVREAVRVALRRVYRAGSKRPQVVVHVVVPG